MKYNKTVVIDGKIQEINVSEMLDITDPVQVKKYNDYMKTNYKKRLKIGIEIKSFLLGNLVDTITTYSGIKWLIKLIFKDCGCEKRRLYLNQWNIYLPHIFLNFDTKPKNFKELQVAPKTEIYPNGMGEQNLKNVPISRSLVAKPKRSCNCKNKAQ